jgi:hypothetical protein
LYTASIMILAELRVLPCMVLSVMQDAAVAAVTGHISNGLPKHTSRHKSSPGCSSHLTAFSRNDYCQAFSHFHILPGACDARALQGTWNNCLSRCSSLVCIAHLCLLNPADGGVHDAAGLLDDYRLAHWRLCQRMNTPQCDSCAA